MSSDIKLRVILNFSLDQEPSSTFKEVCFQLDLCHILENTVD